MKGSLRIYIASFVVLSGTMLGCQEKSDQPSMKGIPAKQGNWPIFRGDNRLTGHCPEPVADNIKLIWSFQTGDEIKSSPVVGLEKVFIGSNDG